MSRFGQCLSPLSASVFGQRPTASFRSFAVAAVFRAPLRASVSFLGAFHSSPVVFARSFAKKLSKKEMAAKAAAEVKEVLLGRPGNNVGIGIVGLPNIGKSSMFNLLSKLNVPAENYPFCTIDPSLAKVPVPDERFDWLVQHVDPKSVMPAVLTIHDIAGLVRGASEGKGLGNEFLSNISSTDAIYHLVRAFKDKTIEHVEATVDPMRDAEIITHELIAKDLKRCSTEADILEKKLQRGVPALIKRAQEHKLDVLKRSEAMLKEGKNIRHGVWDSKDVEVLNELQFLSAKPVVFLVNIALEDFKTQKNKWLAKFSAWVKQHSPESPMIPFSVTFEQQLLEMSDADREKYLAETKLRSQINKIITSGYHALNLCHFFTFGKVEVRAWTFRKGALAPQAAGVIHSDFEKNFICAETMSYEDLREAGSEAQCKNNGKVRQQGKNYVVQDGDILFIKHNARK